MPKIAIAESFLPALAELEHRERDLTTAFVQKLMTEHVRSGTSLERINNAKMPNLWSARISQELRAILYQEGDTYLLLHVGHHDAAYAWAERRKLTHDQLNNRLQIVETEERRVQVEVPVVVHVSPPIFAQHTDEYLLSLGVDADWLPALRELRDLDQVLDLASKLPDEVVESLLDVANGKLVTPPPRLQKPSVFHPNSSRRYYVVENEDDLARALQLSLEDWMLFLHPDQRQLVEGIFTGPVHIVGPAGTGKTTVALHRARELARREARVLFATFTRSLADNLGQSLDRLCSPQERERVEVSTLHRQALQIARSVRPELAPLSEDEMVALLRGACGTACMGEVTDLVVSEWRGVIGPFGLTDWERYREVSRVGRGTALRMEQRYEIWKVVSKARQQAWQSQRLDWASICSVARRAIVEQKAANPFQALLVDEVQDLGVAELRLVEALSRNAPGHLMLFGDVQQRIYGRRSAFDEADINLTGRVFSLRTNYRTTDAIRRVAESTLEDLAEGGNSRSLLRGPAPYFHGADSESGEQAFVLERLAAWQAQGMAPEEIAILARTEERLEALRGALGGHGYACSKLFDREAGAVRVGTIHSAKGLEFKAVALVGCDDGTIPLRFALNAHADPLDREAQLEQERHLLYVAMTRAREELALSWVGTPSRWVKPESVPEAPRA